MVGIRSIGLSIGRTFSKSARLSAFSTGAASNRGSLKESEVEKFKSSEWWDPYGDCAELHRMNPIRCRFLRNVVLRHFQTSRSHIQPLMERSVLDVGCGGGILSEALGRLGGDVTAIDILPRNIDIAQQHVLADPVLASKITYRCVAAEALLEQGRQFDVVVASEVVEHVNRPDVFMQTLSGLVNPNGVLCVTTINRTLPSLVGAIWIAEYVLGMVPKGTHDWKAFLTPGELAMAAKRSGMILDQLTGFRMQSLTRQWSFSSDVSINYAASFVKAHK